MALLFSTIDVTKQCFFRGPSAFGIVNLKPILPGHVLVIPRRVVPRLSELQADEMAGLFNSVQTIGRVIERAYQAEGLTIACQVANVFLYALFGFILTMYTPKGREGSRAINSTCSHTHYT